MAFSCFSFGVKFFSVLPVRFLLFIDVTRRINILHKRFTIITSVILDMDVIMFKNHF